MNQRQRFHETILFGQPDRVPFAPGRPGIETLAAWYGQGLLRDASYDDLLQHTLGVQPEATKPRINLGVSFGLLPTDEPNALLDAPMHWMVQDWTGALTELAECHELGLLGDVVAQTRKPFHIQTRRDWEAIKVRYEPTTPGRFPHDFGARCAAVKDRDWVLSLQLNGPFSQLRRWLGLPRLCLMLVEIPDFVHEMVTFWRDFVSRTLAPVLDHVQLDAVSIVECVAHKAHSLISPAMVCEFLLPVYETWIQQIYQSGCPIVSLHSDGCIEELLPLWQQAGIRCCGPIEVAGGNDIVAYSELMGTGMAFQGGIDKRAISAGGEVMRDEVRRVVQPLLHRGGYLPGCDGMVPPEVSWLNFVEYSRFLAHLTGWL